MKKNVCSLFESGVYYNVYEENGYYIKENAETKEVSYISNDEYNFYKFVSVLNDKALEKKGISNDYYSDDEKDNLEQDIIPKEMHDEFEISFIDEVKGVSEGKEYDEDEDERILRELEALIDQKETEKGQKREERLDNLDLEDELEITPDEFAFLGLDYSDAEDDHELDETPDELLEEMSFPKKEFKKKKEGLLHRVVGSRKPRKKINLFKKNKKEKVKKEKIKPEKVQKTKKTKVKKEKKAKIPKEKTPKVKKEKEPKIKKEHSFKLHRVKSARPYKPKNTNKFSRVLLYIGAISLGVSLIAASYKFYGVYKDSRQIAFEFNEEESRMQTIKDTFIKVIGENKTISNEVSMELKYYLNKLYSYELSDEAYSLIFNNLYKQDYTGVTSVGIDELSSLFEGNQNALLIAHELYNYKNDIPHLTITKYQWLADVLSFSDDATKLLLEGENVNMILKTIFNIDETIDVNSQSFANGEGNNIKMFIEDLKVNSFGKVSSSCEIENNIFDSHIRIYDNNVGCYLYFDKETKNGVSEEVYRDKLEYMLNNRIEELDYTNVRDRELLYFYANALLDTNNATSGNLTDLIMNGVVNSNYHVFDIFDLMRYMSGSEVNHLKAVYLYGLIVYGEDALPLLQEINMCFKMDVEDGLISQETYDAFIEQLNIGMDVYAPNMKEEFKKASDANKHMDGYTLKLFGGIEL